MTDNEIIKALECCREFVTVARCDECPLKEQECIKGLPQYALSLINRQKAEIERLTKHIDELNEQAEYLVFLNKEAKAIKEFAERLKEKLVEESYDDCEFFKVVGESEIDNLVKEMVGEDK